MWLKVGEGQCGVGGGVGRTNCTVGTCFEMCAAWKGINNGI